MKRIGMLISLGAAGIGLLISALVAPASAAWEPKGQSECIAPANPGGGFDAICRSTSAVL